jgi:hypothetical protein
MLALTADYSVFCSDMPAAAVKGLLHTEILLQCLRGDRILMVAGGAHLAKTAATDLFPQLVVNHAAVILLFAFIVSIVSV